MTNKFGYLSEKWPQSRRLLVLVFIVIICLASAIAQQNRGNFNREHAKIVLSVIKDDVKKNYYDPEFHGIDLDARFKVAEEKLNTADSTGQLMGIVAQTLLDFEDSHLFFLPPGRVARTNYGWEMQSIGNEVYVSAIKPGSDAEVKGLKPGDRVLEVNGYEPTRENLWKLDYMFQALRPQPGLRVLIQKPDGKRSQLDVMAKIRSGKQVKDLTNTFDWNDLQREAADEERLDRSRWQEFGDQLIVWKMPTFAVEDSHVTTMLGRIKKFKTVIIDLRGNGGGYVDTCARMLGGFFEKDMVIARNKGRKEIKPMKTKSSPVRFDGNVIVLIDSRSASASEIFARAIQLEKRGIVIGDRSAGAVMRARHYSHQIGIDTVIPYGVSVTDADVIMNDGKSLEKTGVMPDQLLLTTGADMAAKRDIVLARAAALAGVQLDPEKAGSLFPIEWRK